MGSFIGGPTVYTTSPIMFLDSPATTSSTTYQVYFRNSGSGNTTGLNYDNSKGSITLMEIKG
jgi:hypothetical protein